MCVCSSAKGRPTNRVFSYVDHDPYCHQDEVISWNFHLTEIICWSLGIRIKCTWASHLSCKTFAPIETLIVNWAFHQAAQLPLEVRLWVFYNGYIHKCTWASHLSCKTFAPVQTLIVDWVFHQAAQLQNRACEDIWQSSYGRQCLELGANYSTSIIIHECNRGHHLWV